MNKNKSTIEIVCEQITPFDNLEYTFSDRIDYMMSQPENFAIAALVAGAGALAIKLIKKNPQKQKDKKQMKIFVQQEKIKNLKRMLNKISTADKKIKLSKAISKETEKLNKLKSS